MKTPSWGTDFSEPGHIQIMGAHFSRLHSLITKLLSFDPSFFWFAQLLILIASLTPQMFKILCQTESQCNLRCLGHSALRYKSPGLTSRKALCNLGPASGLSLQSHLQVPSLLFSLYLGQHKCLNKPFTHWSDLIMHPPDWSVI